MIPVPQRLRSYLEDHHVHYEILHHPTHFTAPEIAADTHTPGLEFAKTIIVKAGGDLIMLVVPAHHLVNCRKLARTLGMDTVRIAKETEISDRLKETFPQCRIGALPPFGELFGMPVYMSESMLDDVYLTFNAGTHEDAIRIAFPDYVELVRPIFGDHSDTVQPAVTRRDTI